MQAELQTRCSPKKIFRIMEFINKKKEMKRAVEEMGFGTLREVPNVKLDLKFIRKLVDDGFDIGRCSFFGEVIKVEDVGSVLGIPAVGESVPTSLLTADIENFKAKFAKKSLCVLQEEMESLEMANETFKETFMLLVLGCFLCPLGKDIPSQDLYSALSVVSNAKRYNWAEFVLDFLIKEVKKYKERIKENVKIKENKVLGGCIHFLLIVFLQRVHPLPVDGKKPLISAWTNDQIKLANKEEKLHALKEKMNNECAGCVELKVRIMKLEDRVRGLEQIIRTSSQKSPCSELDCDVDKMDEDVEKEQMTDDDVAHDKDAEKTRREKQMKAHTAPENQSCADSIAEEPRADVTAKDSPDAIAEETRCTVNQEAHTAPDNKAVKVSSAQPDVQEADTDPNNQVAKVQQRKSEEQGNAIQIITNLTSECKGDHCSVQEKSSKIKSEREQKRKRSEFVDDSSYFTKKTLVLDVNGLLADIVPENVVRSSRPSKQYKIIRHKAVFKRPHVDDFLEFCYERFNVGVWSSRLKKNLDPVLDYVFGNNYKSKLAFQWDQEHCTNTGHKVPGNKDKPVFLKEIKKLWEDPELRKVIGVLNESNTLLLDDSPYKAKKNPPNTSIFPDTYKFDSSDDNLLGDGGDLRGYLEKLSSAPNVQKFVEQNKLF